MSGSRALSALAVAVLAGCILALNFCAQTPTEVQARSLERSGSVSFVCLSNAGQPTDGPPGLPLGQCTGQPASIDNYIIPHLIALVTQTGRGEVAAIDITAGTVLDADPSTPGFNFLPVGAQPTDIVSTPGGQATFVSVAEANRPGIFAIPSWQIPRGRTSDEPQIEPVPELTSWPACRLPAAPGKMVMLNSPAASALPPGGVACGSPPSATSRTDLSLETDPPGPRMLVVTIPELGEIDVIDAQWLVDQPRGSFSACQIAARIPLAVDRATAGTTDPSCPPAKRGIPVAGPTVLAQTVSPHPSGIAYAPDDTRVFVADDGAPVIHVLDGPTPCQLHELAPLLPASEKDPTRSVVTSAIGVSPLTGDGNRYVYAVDLKGGGTVMAFDVSPNATSRTPMHLTNTGSDPYMLPDRIQIGSPARAINFILRDVPNPVVNQALDSGVVRSGLRCDPNPGTDGYIFQTNFPDYTSGASPNNLRGIFALLTLSSGEIAIVDIDDFDQDCRNPDVTGTMLGCPPGDRWAPLPGDYRELSCNVVERHHVRSSRYFVNSDIVGHYAPTMTSTPSLRELGGGVLPFDPSVPKLLGPSGLGDNLNPVVTLGGGTLSIEVADGGASSDAGDDAGDASTDAAGAATSTAAPSGAIALSPDPNLSTQNWVSFDLSEPRAHVQQFWTIAYEGQLSDFTGLVAQLQCRQNQPKDKCDPPAYDLYDSAALFCDRGVHGADVAPKGQAGDLVQIVDGFPDPSSSYWPSVAGTCTYNACFVTFGRPESPTAARDFTIEAAYQDHLQLAAQVIPDATDPTGKPLPVTCCFPTPAAYTVRGRNQWIVNGSVTGFSHHVVPDSSNANHCIDSCDPDVALHTSRAYGLPPGSKPPRYDDVNNMFLFRNPQMRFVVWNSEMPNADQPLLRDTAFIFQEGGGFNRLSINLAAAGTDVSPQTVRYVAPLQTIMIADGASLGLALVDLSTQTYLRSYY